MIDQNRNPDRKIGKITADMGAERLPQDLERYREMALELGATQAKILRADEIIVDPRVVLKCRMPRCFSYGVSAHCPPHALKPAELKEHLAHYRWAVFFIKDIPSKVIALDKAIAEETRKAYLAVSMIVGEIESAAFYDGHHLAVGFAAGSCRRTFCAGQESCQALEGKHCRFAQRARSSMESVGMDVFRMAAEAGWDIYPVGSGAKPEEITKGTLAGIVIVQ